MKVNLPFFVNLNLPFLWIKSLTAWVELVTVTVTQDTIGQVMDTNVDHWRMPHVTWYQIAMRRRRVTLIPRVVCTNVNVDQGTRVTGEKFVKSPSSLVTSSTTVMFGWFPLVFFSLIFSLIFSLFRWKERIYMSTIFALRRASCEYSLQERGFRCQCIDGYKGDGSWCQPIRPCNEDPRQCDPNAVCEPNPSLGTYACHCRKG